MQIDSDESSKHFDSSDLVGQREERGVKVKQRILESPDQTATHK